MGGLQLGEGERRADGEVDVAFVLADAADDALGVLAGGFGVGAVLTETELAGFEGGAGLPLVGDAVAYTGVHGHKILVGVAVVYEVIVAVTVAVICAETVAKT